MQSAGSGTCRSVLSPGVRDSSALTPGVRDRNGSGRRSRMMVRKRCGFTVNSGDAGDPQNTKPDLNATSSGPDLRHMAGQALPLPSPESGTRKRKTNSIASHVATRQAQLLWGVAVMPRWSTSQLGRSTNPDPSSVLDATCKSPRHPVTPSKTSHDFGVLNWEGVVAILGGHPPRRPSKRLVPASEQI